MLELVYVEKGRVEWREADEPALQGSGEALVRPLAVATCDLDAAIIKGNAPFTGPFPMGHEFVAEVVDIGDDVRGAEIGQTYAVPFQIACGTCAKCSAGLTDACTTSPGVSMYGVGPLGGNYGGALSDLVRVPFADAMLLPVPAGVDPVSIASASDNIPDAYRAVAPLIDSHPGADVLIVGGAGRGSTSIGLYACQFAQALGAGRVDYADSDEHLLSLAASLGANPIPFEGDCPRRLGPYGLTVDTATDAAGLALAVRSTDAGGICTSVSIHYGEYTEVPMLEMYTTGLTLRASRAPARALMPRVLELIAEGRFDPTLVTTKVVGWDDAADALMEAPAKLIVAR